MQESKTHQQVRPALCVEAQTVKQPKSSLRCNTTQLPGGLSSCGSEGSEKARAGQGGGRTAGCAHVSQVGMFLEELWEGG